MDYTKFFTHTTKRMKSSMIRELVASTKGIPGLISFAGGFPAPATFPREQLSAIYHDVVLQEGNDVLQYGASEGDIPLKKAIRDWEGFEGITDDEMLITVGSTNAIYYYSRCFVEPGDVIFYEAPSFLGSLVAFDAFEAELVAVEIDDEGIIPAKLEAAILTCREQNKTCKFLYTIPDFQNPSGVTMSLARREALLELAHRYDLPILEDNPYSELRYCGTMVPTLLELSLHREDTKYLVTHVKSFSKILGPGMRCAYVIGHEDLINKMCSWQQKVNVTPDCVTARVIARYLESGIMPAHLQKVADYYRPLLQAMLNSLEAYMPAEVKWTKPDGGIFVWLELPEKINADELFVKAREKKVSFIPGSKFFAEGQEKWNSLRLNFTFASPEQIDQGVKRLAEIIRESL